MGSLVCCSPWGHKELNMTERLNWTEAEFPVLYRSWLITYFKYSSVCMGPFEGGSHYLRFLLHSFSLVQLSSVAQLGPTLGDPMDCSTPGFSVLHQLQELTQTQVHRVGDAIQPSHPPSSPSPPALIFPSIRVFFQWVGSPRAYRI